MDREELGGSQNSEQASAQTAKDVFGEQQAAVESESMEKIQINMNDGSMSEVAEETTITETSAPRQVADAQAQVQAPQAPENPVPQAAAAVQPTPVAQPVAAVNAEPAAPTAKPKSKGTGIVIAIVAVLVLALGGLATWFFVFFNNPTKVVSDAVSGFLSAEHLAMQGDVWLEPSNPDSSDEVKKIWLSFSSNSRELSPSSHSGAMNVELANDDAFTVFFDYKIAQDHRLFVRFSSVTEALETMEISQANYPDRTKFFDVVEMIDDQWWEVDLAKLVKDYDLDASISDYYNGYMDCTDDYLSVTLQDRTLSKLYLDHSFFDIKESGVKLDNFEESGKSYSVKIDPELAADFMNGLISSDSADTYFKCLADKLDQSYDANDIEKYDADDIKDSLPDDYQLLLDINPWTHRLNAVHGEYKDSSVITTANLKFTYEDVPYEDPEEYRPISDLIDELQQHGTEFWNDFGIIVNDVSDQESLDSGYSFDEDDYDYSYDDDWDVDWNDDDDYGYSGEELEN